jgi:hypothetical protein
MEQALLKFQADLIPTPSAHYFQRLLKSHGLTKETGRLGANARNGFRKSVTCNASSLDEFFDSQLGRQIFTVVKRGGTEKETKKQIAQYVKKMELAEKRKFDQVAESGKPALAAATAQPEAFNSTGAL